MELKISDIAVQKQKIINAFKGLITTYKLVPTLPKNTDIDSKYKASGRYFSNEKDGDLELYHRDKPFLIVLELVTKLYSGQTDRNLTSRLIRDTLNDWITEGKNFTEPSHLEEVCKEFFDKVEANIKNRLVFLPIEGLEFNSSESLSLGDCQLYKNDKNSDFMKVIQQDKRRSSKGSKKEVEIEKKWTDKVKSYFTYKTIAHSGKAMEQGVEKANIALNILRLYISSYYFNENKRAVVRRMGLYGSMQLGERSHIFYIDPYKSIEDQYPGTKQSSVIQESFKINREFIKYMKANGLDRINRLAQLLGSKHSEEDVARRFMRAIAWFGKATSAKSLADSYLMYAIAIEALLSEGRTSKETYSVRIASLITCDSDESFICPVGGYVSSEFKKQLQDAKTLKDRFDIVREKVLKLFSYRNQIAHGAVLDNEVKDVNLLDFETIVQNAILSFAKKEWPTFGDFKAWIKTMKSELMPEE